MDEPTTEAYHISLVASRATLVLFLPHSERQTIPSLARSVDALLYWLLGAAAKGFRVHLWWRDDPRLLGADEWPSRRNVNGGFATAGEPEVFVYRREEYDRVILHEVIHACQWDWPHMPTRALECWNLGAHAQLAPHLFEAWTELYAEWLWCGWHNMPWSRQRTWMNAQATQILARSDAARWAENTNVFAYYVLKAALAPHIDFLWTCGQSCTAAERMYILCTLAGPGLAHLRLRAAATVPHAISLRMTSPADGEMPIPT
jgi:hypothetical protein